MRGGCPKCIDAADKLRRQIKDKLKRKFLDLDLYLQDSKLAEAFGGSSLQLG